MIIFNNINHQMKKISARPGHNIIELRPHSPIRSTCRSPAPVSPLTKSPFVRRGPVSPLRTRPDENRRFSRTPQKSNCGTKLNTERNQPSDYENHKMQKTIRNGIGLFQQLAFKTKPTSDKKSLKPPASQAKFFEFGEKYVSNFREKSQNIQEIESVQNYKVSDKSNSTIKLSFKNMERSKQMESTVKNHNNNNNLRNEDGIYSNLQIPSYEQPSLIRNNSCLIKPRNEVEESYGEIFALIKKASVKTKEHGPKYEECVKISMQDEENSLTMSPYL